MILATGRFGAAHVSAMGILFQLWGICWAVFWGFGLAAQVRVGQCLGAGHAAAARRAAQVSLGLVLACTLFVSCPFLLGRHLVGHVFVSHDHGDDSAEQTLHLVAAVLPIMCLAFCCSSVVLWGAAVLEGMALATRSMIVTGVLSWVLVLPLAYFFGLHRGLGVQGMWYGAALGEGCKAAVMLVVVFLADWRGAMHAARTRSEVSPSKQAHTPPLQPRSLPGSPAGRVGYRVLNECD